MQKSEIEALLEKGAEALDITPTMFKEAKSHYDAMGNFLEGKGIQADVRPIGSIVMGTIIRPLTDDEDGYFDIDVLVERTDVEKSSCSEADVRDPIEQAFASSDRYSDKIEDCETCITLRYVWNGIDGGFRIDLDACVADTNNPKAIECITYPEYAQSAVAIARRPPRTWLGSNPKGLCNWFLQKNERFSLNGRMLRKQALYENNATIFASVEDVPDGLDRSSLQRAIQVLKRSRDEFYERCRQSDGADSFVLAILCTNLSDGIPSNASTLEVLKHFISALSDENDPVRYQATGLTREPDGTWRLDNPVYGENVLRDWTSEDAALFFHWIKDLSRNLMDLAAPQSAKNQMSAEALFGKKIGSKISRTVGVIGATSPAPSLITPTKPWGHA